LWVAEGVDYWPLELQSHLLERVKEKLSITGDQQKLLNLIGLHGKTLEDLVVSGYWRSPDNIDVRIYSALVDPQHSKSLAKQASSETAFSSYLPYRESGEEGSEYETNPKEGFKAWTTMPSTKEGLDEYDQLGAKGANRRPRFSSEIIVDFSLQAADSFNRKWVNSSNIPVARAESWLQRDRDDDDGGSSGERLLCTAAFLTEVLSLKRAELLVLIKLERYEKNYSGAAGEFSNTTAVVRIDESLSYDYIAGAINKQLKTRV